MPQICELKGLRVQLGTNASWGRRGVVDAAALRRTGRNMLTTSVHYLANV